MRIISWRVLLLSNAQLTVKAECGRFAMIHLSAVNGSRVNDQLQGSVKYLTRLWRLNQIPGDRKYRTPRLEIRHSNKFTIKPGKIGDVLHPHKTGWAFGADGYDWI
jgi:hypothetical protein